jgi:benzoyl-CoA reductase/2-hydroxyglutaryl-CoA dehydratase subunit BcrC/BadD/HgdB
MVREIGTTTTVPTEILFAAGARPVDLCNLFISAPEPLKLVEEAEAAGFPRSICSWNKGMYAVARRTGLRELIAVTSGDCSSSGALGELLESEGVKVIKFAYPGDRDPVSMKQELAKLAARLGTDLDAAENMRIGLERVRGDARRVDELTWRDGRVTGLENHFWLVSCADMLGDPHMFEQRISVFLAEAEKRKAREWEFRLGLVGVPPICAKQLHGFLEENGACAVFNETQRQFSMPAPAKDMVEQYLSYTYPYDVATRLTDIEAEISRRRIKGIIHYVQSFCHRHIHDRILRGRLSVPVLTLEFDRPGVLDGQTRTRIQAFLEMVGV